jgi:ribose transport system permease protein
MKKILGIAGVLAAICVIASVANPDFLSAYNLQNILKRTALYGILGLGAGFVIMSGGIDLSIGSMVALVGCVFPILLMTWHLPVAVVFLLIFLMVFLLGLIHGLLITKLRLQPFVVTLCGLLLYRGIARWITGDSITPSHGFAGPYEGLRVLATGRVAIPFVTGFSVPVPFLILLAVTVVAAVFLNLTVYGRYLLAVGRNEQAARYSGINTHAVIILAYVLCSALTGLAGVLFLLDNNSIQPPQHGTFYELYAIAAAVLGGCSLRGGEGSILGIVLGAALIPVLNNASNLLGYPTRLEFAIIGVVILVGVIVDELVKRMAAARRARRGAAAAEEERTAARVA